MRRSVSSPDEPAEYSWRTSRCFIWWWNTVSNALYYFSNKMILEGQVKKKISRFSSAFQTRIKHWFPLYFLCELLISLRSNNQFVQLFYATWYLAHNVNVFILSVAVAYRVSRDSHVPPKRKPSNSQSWFGKVVNLVAGRKIQYRQINSPFGRD